VMYTLGHKEDKRHLAGGSRVSRFTVAKADPPRADPASETVLLEWIEGGHNGCALKFGPDGFLYISTGDGTSPNPPDDYHTGQDLRDLLASILRIDVDHPEGGRAYSIPKDNPFVATPGARPEIWAYGFRNPWRMTFDRATGDLWAGDVGWEKWELVYRIRRGGNYGWSVMEGSQPVNLSDAPGPTPILPPDHAVPHPEGQSITGGFVYRGRKFPELVGSYVYGDWATRLLWANAWDGTRLGDRRTIAITEERIVGFEEDADGELLILDHQRGGIHRLERNTVVADGPVFPRRLSETGLFASTPYHIPAPGVFPYQVNAALWMDGAEAERFVALPARERIGGNGREWAWPKDSALAKTISLDGRRIETQLLHFNGTRWNAYAYAWNDAQTDADLVDAAGVTKTLTIAGRERRWNVLPRAACLTCHNNWPGYALSMSPFQLSRTVDYPEGTDDQLRVMKHLGLAPADVRLPDRSRPFVDPYDSSEHVSDRARSYLHVNCAHCHRRGAGGATMITLRGDPMPRRETRGSEVLNVRPKLGDFGLAAPYIVCGGDPSRSALFYRVSKLGRGRMPHLGSEVLDEAGVDLLARWIATLPAPPDPSPARDADRSALFNLRRGDVAALDRLLATTSGALDVSRSAATLPPGLRAEAARRGLAHSNALIRDLFEPFARPGSIKRRLGTSVRPEDILSLQGDFDRGRDLVFDSPAQCRACHRFGTGDEKLGPDLGKIGSKYDRRKLLETILDPSKEIEAKFVNYLVETTGGAVYSGVVVERTPDRIVLQDPEKTIPLEVKSIRRIVAQQKSIMPDYQLQDLTAQEAADLMEFLAGLKE
jgi:putative heme-binding domain-containing protein